MRRRWTGLALGVLTIFSGSIARGEDVACCEAECHFSDDAGHLLHSMQRRDMTQSECESRFQGCKITWGDAACDANPDGATFGMRGKVMQREE